MSDFSIELPADFDEYEWQAEAKGWYSEARMIVSGKRYQLNFYDAVRLAQTIEDDLQSGGVFFEPNLVVVRRVTESEMERAAELLVQSGQVASLVAE
jgi:hypothetical protein